eukprot:3995556-Prymnesium_polylepis.1
MLKKPRVRSPFTTGLQHVERTATARAPAAAGAVRVRISLIEVGLGAGHLYNVACTIPGPLDRLSQHGAALHAQGSWQGCTDSSFLMPHAARTIGQKEKKADAPHAHHRRGWRSPT